MKSPSSLKQEGGTPTLGEMISLTLYSIVSAVQLLLQATVSSLTSIIIQIPKILFSLLPLGTNSGGSRDRRVIVLHKLLNKLIDVTKPFKESTKKIKYILDKIEQTTTATSFTSVDSSKLF